MDRVCLCRLCGHTFKCDVGHYLFEDDQLNLISKIQSVTNILIFEHDELPKYICNACHLTLELSYSFQTQCIAVQVKLIKLLEVSPVFHDEEREIQIQVAPKVKSQSSSTSCIIQNSKPNETRVQLNTVLCEPQDSENVEIILKDSELITKCNTITDEINIFPNESVRNINSVCIRGKSFGNKTDNSLPKVNECCCRFTCERASLLNENAPQNVSPLCEGVLANQESVFENSNAFEINALRRVIQNEPDGMDEYGNVCDVLQTDPHTHSSPDVINQISLKENSCNSSSKCNFKLGHVNSLSFNNTVLRDSSYCKLHFADNSSQNVAEQPSDDSSFSCGMSNSKAGEKYVPKMSSCDTMLVDIHTGELQPVKNPSINAVFDPLSSHTYLKSRKKRLKSNQMRDRRVNRFKRNSKVLCSKIVADSHATDSFKDPCETISHTHISSDIINQTLKENSRNSSCSEIVADSHAADSFKDPCGKMLVDPQTGHAAHSFKEPCGKMLVDPQTGLLEFVEDCSSSLELVNGTDVLELDDCASDSFHKDTDKDHSYDKHSSDNANDVIASSAGTTCTENFQASGATTDLSKAHSGALPPLTICGEPFEVNTLISRADILQYIFKYACVDSSKSSTDPSKTSKRSRIAHASKYFNLPDKTDCKSDTRKLKKGRRIRKSSLENDKSIESTSSGNVKNTTPQADEVTQAHRTSAAKDTSGSKGNVDPLTKGKIENISLCTIQPNFVNEEIKHGRSEKQLKSNNIQFCEAGDNLNISEATVLEHKSFTDTNQDTHSNTPFKLNKPQYVCEVCGEQFQYRLSYTTHFKNCVKNIHEHNLVGKSVVEHLRSSDKQDTNSNTFVSLEKLDKHQNLELYLCEACGKSFTDFNALTFHTKMLCKKRETDQNVCGSKPKPGSKPKMFKCKKCGRKFCFVKTLEIHTYLHLNNNLNYLCNLCGKMFERKLSLDSHYRNH